jgi:AAA domain-containing protein
MGRRLEVRKVRLGGIATEHAWTFPPGVTIIAGDVGGGKTTLLNLIKFGMGGDAPITKKLGESAESVTLEIRAGERNLSLHRGLSSQKNRVAVSEGDQSLGEFALKAGSSKPWVSDLLLGALGIPSVRVPQARSHRSRSHRITSVSFQDVFAYCYLDQEQVDRSTIYDNDSFRGPKREWTFELLNGIIDGELAGLETHSEEMKEESEERQKRLTTVESFVEAKQLPASATEIGKRLAAIGAEEEGLRRTLESVYEGERKAVADAGSGGDQIDSLTSELSAARAEKRRLSIERDEVSRAANQLQRDLREYQEGLAAKDVLEPLAYVVCPRCEQSLDGRPIEQGHCSVCLQPDRELAENELEATARRLEDQFHETRQLRDQLEEAESDFETLIQSLRNQLGERRAVLKVVLAEAAEPFRIRVNEIQEELGRLQGERLALEAGLPLEAAVREERSELQTAEPEIAALEEKAEQRRADLSSARSHVEELSVAFDTILRDFTLPWLEVAEVDQATYLPMVNGQKLRELSSGGMKATTNVAYYLASFVTALRDHDILTPSFLMLDSIRKDYGGGEKDLARSDRIYRYLQTLQEMRTQGPLPRDFQLIVVDNDLPDAFEGAFNTILIDPDRPLIRT